MDALIQDTINRANNRLFNSVCDKMVFKKLSFDVAFENSVKTLRKGMSEEVKQRLKAECMPIAKEHCELLGYSFN